MVKIILFDIDNTIYSKRTGVQEILIKRAKQYIKDNLEIPWEIPIFIEKLTNKYGSILSGLIYEYDIDPNEFIHFVFDVNLSQYLEPNPRLRQMLDRLDFKKYAFSNSPREHVESVLGCLDVLDCFTGIYDRRFFGYKSKSDCEVYQLVVDDLDMRAEECILVDDKQSNIQNAKDFGMHTILIHEDNTPVKVKPEYMITTILEVEEVIGPWCVQ